MTVAKWFVGIWAGIVLPAFPNVLHAQIPSPSEYEVKAAFLYNFAKFVEWPPAVLESADGSFTICVLGEDPFGRSVEGGFDGKTVQDKKLIFRTLARSSDASACQMVFISDSEDDHLPEILDRMKTQPSVLTVSDIDRFIQRGGMVGFTLDRNKVRFNVNLAAATDAHLKISSQMLKLAQTVTGSGAVKGEE